MNNMKNMKNANIFNSSVFQHNNNFYLSHPANPAYPAYPAYPPQPQRQFTQNTTQNLQNQTVFYPIDLDQDAHNFNTSDNFDLFCHEGIDNNIPGQYFNNQGIGPNIPNSAQKPQKPIFIQDKPQPFSNFSIISVEDMANLEKVEKKNNGKKRKYGKDYCKSFKDDRKKIGDALRKFNPIHQEILDLTGHLKSRDPNTAFETCVETWLLIENYKNCAHALGLLLLEVANKNKGVNTNEKELLERKYIKFMNLVKTTLENLKENNIDISQDSFQIMFGAPKQLLENFNKLNSTKNQNSSNLNSSNSITQSKKQKKKIHLNKYNRNYECNEVISVKKFTKNMSEIFLRFYTENTGDGEIFQPHIEDFCTVFNKWKNYPRSGVGYAKLTIEDIKNVITYGYCCILFILDLGEKAKNNPFPFEFMDICIRLKQGLAKQNPDLNHQMKGLMLNVMTPARIARFMHDVSSGNAVYPSNPSNIKILDIKKRMRDLDIKSFLNNAIQLLNADEKNSRKLPNLSWREFLVSVNPDWNDELKKHFPNSFPCNAGTGSTSLPPQQPLQQSTQQIVAPVFDGLGYIDNLANKGNFEDFDNFMNFDEMDSLSNL